MARHQNPRDRQEHRQDPSRDERYYELRTLTSRAWGRSTGVDDSFGPRELGGYGDFRESGRPGGGREQEGSGERDPTARSTGGKRGRGPRAARGDTSIADEVYQRLSDDERIDAREILLAVSDGVVTLTGEVPSRAMKRMAEDVAADVRGVRDVANRITVDDGSASFGPAGRPVRSGHDQLGSGFSSSERTEEAWQESSVREGRAGHENLEPEQQAARRNR